MKLKSGAQTGVDLGVADAADECGVEWSGWAPMNGRNENGPIPEKYLRRMRRAPSPGFPARTALNVASTDATVLIYRHTMTGGTGLTEGIAIRARRPVFYVDLSLGPLHDNHVRPEELRRFLEQYETVNIAGPRESKCPGIYAEAKALLLEALR